MPDHTEIYQAKAETYDVLISKQPDLLRAVEEICAVEEKDVVDLGAGTGRLTLPLARKARSILALDASTEMLRVAEGKLNQAGFTNCQTRASDHRRIEAADNSADLLVSGWSICYTASSNQLGWEKDLEKVMEEIRRVLRPGGTAVIFETMGTGAEQPHPPDFLLPYYERLEQQYGFHHRWLRTDYQFDSVEEAVRLTEFFFGRELAGRVEQERMTVLPECAGMWWREF
ncbi:class I SAM-dependent methyltransferase [Paenibacillus sambharensis]|uniref:Class I SAM-dependent methyltransferase n=1 Tax=Paenibacillus sambharensis TaxID=1803190 RepID=A0A2W1LFD6_9BACL|nr:class I SAM-dependent methyltransferase [Paenibacillus sambharensis]PZD93765.1 class I SAM-dependent methyltransferase [Paenibacillus sambharensis]